MSIKSGIARHVNDAIRPLNVQVIRGTSVDPAIKNFLPARRTLAAAAAAGLPLGTFIDQQYAEPGATPDAVREMIALGGLTGKCDVVCEIGPGTGRYAVEVIEALHPRVYEIYETARDWIPTLKQLPGAILRPADGRTLSATPDASVDLVHAHKVFVYLEFYAIIGYVNEMARVVRPGGGVVAFDVVTEDCLDKVTIHDWVRDGTLYRPLPRAWIVEFMREKGLDLCGSHFTTLPPGKSELLVFRHR
jgi:hypothetical protein